MSTRLVLVIGAILIAIGIFKPDLSKVVINNKPTNPVVVVDVEEPTDEALKTKALAVVDALKKGSSDRKKDGLDLSALYKDLATLISLDNENLVVKTTDEIREANSVAGMIMNLDLKGKYPGLAESCNDVVVSAIGDDNLLVSPEIRTNAVAAFKALSWACNQGAK